MVNYVNLLTRKKGGNFIYINNHKAKIDRDRKTENLMTGSYPVELNDAQTAKLFSWSFCSLFVNLKLVCCLRPELRHCSDAIVFTNVI